jgi:hypothetical protein
MQPSLPIRGLILEQASNATLKQRNAVYGEPFPDMELAAQLKALYKAKAGNKYHPAHDEAMDRVFEKIARISSGVMHDDNYVDGAAYLAIAAECQTLATMHEAMREASRTTAEEISFILAEDVDVVGLVVEDPINRDTALPKTPHIDIPSTAAAERAESYGMIEPYPGLRFVTQESSVVVWVVVEVFEDGWFSAKVEGTESSLSPDHRRPRMPASAIFKRA